MKNLCYLFATLFWIVGTSAGQWINCKSAEARPVITNLIENVSNSIVIEVILPGYFQNKIDINGKTFTKLSIPNAPTFLDKGYPELPRINSNIVIPNAAKMQFEILEVESDTISIEPIAPSKGSLPRSVDPEKVPYTFSDIYITNIFWPENIIELSKPFIIRDLRGITLRFNPFRYNAVMGKLITYKRIVVKVFAEGIDNVNVKNNEKGKRIDKDFMNLYKRFFLNYEDNQNKILNKSTYDDIAEAGRMLIIVADDFYNNLIPLRDWRTRKGNKTILVKCSDIGTTVNAIKNYIQNMYNTQESVTYILLVGEGNNADIPSKSIPYPGTQTAPTDPTYVLLEGDDPYPDAYISRISASNIDDVKNQIARIINYEASPVIGTWFQKACGIASHEGNPADTTRCNLLRNDLLTYGYTSVDKLYDITTSSPITNAIYNGRGIVNYIGHGTETEWGFNYPYVWPLFSVTDVQNLSSTGMLPFIFSVACEVGSFSEIATCFSEAWLRSGTENSPIGAIGFYGSSIGQPWVEPTVAQAEAIDLLVNDAKLTIGGLCFNGSCKMIEDYPGTGPGVFNTWHIFGDAATHIWTKNPSTFSSISITDNGNSITVNIGSSTATICVSSLDNGSSFWQYQDNISSYTFNTSIRPLYITITKHNYIPFLGISGGMINGNISFYGILKVMGDLTVDSGATLTIEPGSTIYIANGKSLIINGTLNAQGTSANKITFTSTSGTWGGI
ncbi:C25 family cysteine peptidase, partial [Melioribacter sp. Ez-97]|uniref:C25 family cysteine peptidase n=1 Tax=Melioribacter sp. Ez-97 TaxID=3423434 RepID=UPI003ED8818F